MYKNVQIIAEVKVASPFGYRAEKSWDELFKLACMVGDIISIHTDSRWEGSFDLVREAKSRTDLPILAKGIHATDEELDAAFAAGADYALVVGRIPERHQEKCLIEPYTLSELATIPVELKAVWNSRNLEDGSRKTETFHEARARFSGWLCQASNLATVADIEPGADAVLVGTNLASFAESLSTQAKD